MLNEPLITAFPLGATPNDAQDYIISEIEEALSQGKKFIIINAPTATGKSYIAKTIANFSDDPTDGFVKACNTYQIYDSEDPQVSEDDLRYHKFDMYYKLLQIRLSDHPKNLQ